MKPTCLNCLFTDPLYDNSDTKNCWCWKKKKSVNYWDRCDEHEYSKERKDFKTHYDICQNPEHAMSAEEKSEEKYTRPTSWPLSFAHMFASVSFCTTTPLQLPKTI